MVKLALGAAKGWHWDVVTVNVPAPVHGGHVVSEPVNLGKGWVGFDFQSRFGAPTKLVNDAAMQALGSHDPPKRGHGPGAERRHSRLDHGLERRPQTLPLDKDRRPDP